MGAMEQKLDALIEAVSDLAGKVSQIESDVTETKDIVTAWKSVRWFGGAIQTTSKFVASATVLAVSVWAIIKYVVIGALAR